MKLAMSGLMAIMVAAAFPAASYAAPRDPGVNHRQHNQQQRIQQGSRSGDLTRGETRHLGREQAAIRHEERRFGRDGFGERHASGRPVRGWDPSIDRREHREVERIRRGIRSGALTRDEAKQLLNEQRAIRREEREYKSDGVLTRDERKDLQHDLNAANQHIYNETHDAERRFR